MKSEISASQLRALYLVSILSPMIRLVPGYTVYLAGRGAVLSSLLALGPEMLYALLISRLIRNGGDLCTRIREGTGKLAGGAFLLLVGLWLSFYSGFILRTSAERLLSTIYQDGNRYFFVAAILAVSLAAAMGSVRTLGRMASVFLPVIAGVLGLSCLFGLMDMRWEYLLPVTPSDIPNALRGAVPIFDVSTVGIWLLLFPVGETGQKSLQRKVLRVPLLLTLVLTVLHIAVMGTISVPIAGTFRNPYFVMVQNLNIFGRAQRVESVVIALWLVTDFLYLAVMLRASGEALRSALGRTDARATVPAAGGAAFVSAFLCGSSTFSVVPLSGFWIPVSNLFFTVVAIPGMLLLSSVRKDTIFRRKMGRKQQYIHENEKEKKI